MELLLTGCALCLAASAFFAWRALKHSDDARAEAARLIKSQAKLASIELTLATHHTAIKRIDGKLGHMQRGNGSSARVYETEQDVHGDFLVPVAGDDMDPALAAEIALQRAPSKAPGGK